MRNLVRLFLFLAVVSAALMACGGEEVAATPTSAPSEIAAATSVAPPKPSATATPEPTWTPTPTLTSTPTQTPTTLPTDTATPTSTPPSAEALVERAFQNMADFEGGHMEMDLTLILASSAQGNEFSMHFAGDMVGDNFQGNMTIGMGSFSFDMEMIKFEGIQYVTNPLTGEWEVSPDEEDAALPGGDVVENIEQGEDEVLEYIGEEILDGIAVHHLAGTSSTHEMGTMFGQPQDRLEIEYWIDVEDELIRMIAIRGKVALDEDNDMMGASAGDIAVQAVTVTLSDFGQHMEITPPDVTPPATPVSSPLGPMATYQDEWHPFSIQFPYDWAEQPANIGETARYASPEGAALAIAVEDTVDIGLGTLTLEEYGDAVVSIVKSMIEDAEIISRTRFTTQQGIEAEIIKFEFFGGAFSASRLIYLHEGRLAFNATYLSGSSLHEALSDIIDYSFNSFMVANTEIHRT